MTVLSPSAGGRADNARRTLATVGSGVATPRRPRLIGAHATWALLIAATIPWRTDVYFDGGLDTVVVSKAALSLAALALSIHLAGGAAHVLEVPTAPFVLMLTYLAVTVVGGMAQGALLSSAVIAVRVLILLTTATLLLTTYSANEALRALVHLFTILSGVAALSGIGTIGGGRLRGVIPPINSNELAFLAAVPVIWAFAHILRGQERNRDFLLIAFGAGVILLSGSRSALAALFVTALAMLTRATRLSRTSFGLVSLLGPVAAYVVFGSDLLSSVFLRGGEHGVATLSNRTIAWDAALTTEHDPWETWFGAGLAQKKIPVPGQWWATQLLDSSWVSAVVQGGYLGFAIVALLALSTLARAFIAPTRVGAVWLGLTTFLVARAVLESGLFDATTAFLVFAITAFGVRTPGPDGSSHDR